MKALISCQNSHSNHDNSGNRRNFDSSDSYSNSDTDGHSDSGSGSDSNNEGMVLVMNGCQRFCRNYEISYELPSISRRARPY